MSCISQVAFPFVDPLPCSRYLVWCGPTCLFLFLLLVLWLSHPHNPCQNECRVAFPLVSTMSSMVSCLTFKSLLHFELIFCEWYKEGSNFILCKYCFSSPIYRRNSLFSSEWSWFPCQILVGPICMGLLLGISVPLVILSVFIQHRAVLIGIIS